jgi:subtilisin family serine protease
VRRHRLPAALLLVVLVATGAGAADGARPKQWNLDRVGAPVAGAAGGGVVVAVVDSGVDPRHPDLRGQLVAGRDVVDDDDDPDDPYGHGTHVAGIVAAAVGGGEVVGVAPGARIMPVRVLDRNGGGSVADVAEGVRWAVAHGARVINLSLGEDTQALLGPSFGDVLREAWDAGAVPVVAAGNQFVTGSGFSDEPALVVTATTRADGKPTYSSGVGSARWGMAAPGGETPDLEREGAILSTYTDGGYAWIAGTSQAAPHVSAAVAVLLELGLSPQEAVDRLLTTAVDLGARGRDSTFGAGRLDLARAVEGLAAPRSAAPTAAPRPLRPGSTVPGATPGPTPGPAPAPAPATAPADPAPTTTGEVTTPSVTGGPAGDDTVALPAPGETDASGAADDPVPRALVAAAAFAVAAACAGSARQLRRSQANRR